MKTHSRSAFSLVEMLVVVSIIGIISSFAIPAVTKMVRGTDVNRAAQMLQDQINQARQLAVVRNRQIEIRFLRFADPETPGEEVSSEGTWKVRGLQIMEVSASGIPIQLGPVQRFPGSMILDEGKYSSLFGAGSSDANTIPLTFKKPGDLDPPLPRVAAESARKYSYVAFRFLPDGSTNLPYKGNWFVTLHSILDSAKLSAPSSGEADPIKAINYFTIQIDPVSGATHAYRPQLG